MRHFEEKNVTYTIEMTETEMSTLLCILEANTQFLEALRLSSMSSEVDHIICKLCSAKFDDGKEEDE